MPRKTKLEKQIQKGLETLAFGGIGDAVSLLYLDESTALEKIPKMNLLNVSEIKRPKGGGMEIKFFDRIKACERLRERLPDRNENDLGFYEALEKSVDNTGSESDI